MSEPDGESELATRRNAKHRRALSGQSYPKTRPRPRTDVIDEKPLVRGEPFRIEVRRILVQPQRLVGHAVRANDHGRRHIRCFKKPAPLRDHLTVTGKYDRLGWIW